MNARSDQNKEQQHAAPKPDLADYVAAKAEQGCLFIGVAAVTVVAALVVFVIGALTGIRGFAAAASIILFVGLAVGLFVGNDVNYRVARMRERAYERATDASPPPTNEA